MPLQATSGAASYDSFGGGVAAVPNYIEECFSTTLYTGNGTTQTITNGIDLAGKGGLVWWKNRTNGTGHGLIDTTRGIDYYLSSNTTDAQDGPVSYISSVSSTGYSIGAGTQFVNQSANNYASWTFRKQPKFFDVVTYTGNGGTPQNIAHSLGSVPGFIVVKPTSITGGWICYHRSLTASGFNPAPYNTINLNSTGSILEDTGAWNSTAPTSTVFTIGSSPDVNTNGATYVAYLFAHDAGGFGLTGTDNVISCGSFTKSGSSDVTVNLGYEPQWILAKSSTNAQNWFIFDTMRGMSWSAGADYLNPNTSSAETPSGPTFLLSATGFTLQGFIADASYIYIAIRRGPMKVPTSGTSVYNAIARAGTGAAANITGVGFPTDLVLSLTRNFSGTDHLMVDRLRGSSAQLFTNLTASESTNATSVTSLASNDGISVGTDYPIQSINYASGYTYVTNFFRRAPSFFDEVCYTGTEVSGQTFNHNLGVVPEMMIVKARDGTTDWTVYHSALGASARIYLNATNAANTGTAAPWNSTTPTSTVFSLGNAGATNLSGTKFVNYLFATCAGVSKCTSFTGNGSSQTINCGFTSGARFVMIKRVDSTGNWVTFDTARGISSGNDPALYLNSTAAEVTGVDAIDPDSTGFIVNQESTFNLNVSSATYIVLAIA